MINELSDLMTDYKLQLKIYNRKNTSYVMIRTVILVVEIILLILAIKNIYRLITLSGILVLFIVFMMICIRHEKVKKFIEDYNKRIEIINRYYKRINDDWDDFIDKGEDFEGDYFVSDLDLIGDHSLFQYLTICHSQRGRELLFKSLSDPDISELNNRQEAIRELNEHLEFCIILEQLSSKGVNTNDQKGAISENSKSHLIELILFSLTSLISIVLACLSLLGIISGLFLILYALILLIICYGYSFIYGKRFDDIESSCKGFDSYLDIFDLVNEQGFKSRMLKDLSEDLSKGSECIHDLTSINNLMSIKKNFIGNILFNVFFPLNSFILYKYHLINKQGLFDSLESFGLLECLISLSVMGVCQNHLCMGELNQEIDLSFDDLRHPLLKNCVGNNFECDNDMIIITGSNMSGKTSFMRTIGINLVLMYAGTYVCASSFYAPYLKIKTSMRVSDNLSKGISTFYGELLRIKDMIEMEAPFIGFIDEIFKGTNYNDRILGATSIINRLKGGSHIIFITTHDFELCDFDHVVNYYFEERYDDESISFDYKIRKGKCQTTNAKYLMERLHII